MSTIEKMNRRKLGCTERNEVVYMRLKRNKDITEGLGTLGRKGGDRYEGKSGVRKGQGSYRSRETGV